MEKLLLIFLCSLCCSVNGQIQLTRQVIGSYGADIQSGSGLLETTAGEPIVSTEANDSLTLTQGFHQPSFFGALSFNLSTTPASCPTATDGSATINALMGCRGPYEVSWSNGAVGSTAQDLGAGLYTVTVSARNCILIETFEIEAGPVDSCEIRFFNAFSPNSDGFNDKWEIENIEAPTFSNNSVEIFNRWGQLIWSGKGYDNINVFWNGDHHQGGEVPSATYYYIATVNEQVYKGFIELTR